LLLCTTSRLTEWAALPAPGAAAQRSASNSSSPRSDALCVATAMFACGKVLQSLSTSVAQCETAVNALLDVLHTRLAVACGEAAEQVPLQVELAPTQGDSSLLLSGDSQIYGDVIFGGGDDQLTVDGLTSGLLSDGVFDGGAGSNSVLFSDFDLADLLSFDVTDDLIGLSLGLMNNGLLSGQFRNFDTWFFADEGGFSTEELANRFSASVPAPSTAPLLALGLAGLWACRTRRSGRKVAQS